MNRSAIIGEIRQKKSYLCIGLDSDIEKIPRHLLTEQDPVFTFNKAIIDATQHLCVSYKINTAFYESLGSRGWESLEKTVDYIPENIFKIADAKRGDIGNTSSQYAKAFFETMNFDAVTVAPYMGADSVQPFLDYNDKWTILLALTSNSGANDFELQQSGEEYLYEKVIKTAMHWGTPANLMFVIGATRPDWFVKIRAISPEHFYLIPGVGTQGGSLKEVSNKAMIPDIGLLVNVSRAIIFAAAGRDFAARAEAAAQAYRQQMEMYF